MTSTRDDALIARLREDVRSIVLRERLGELGLDERRSLAGWRRQSAAHEHAYREELRLWQIAHRAISEDVGAAKRRRSPPLTRPLTRRGVLVGAGCLSSAAAMVYAGGVLGLLPDSVALLSDHRTGRGELATLQLDDGVEIRLDGNTALDVNTAGVTLHRGAALFTLPASSVDQSTFEILAGPSVVRAATGSISLDIFDDVIEIACIEGSAIMAAPAQIDVSAGTAVRVMQDGVTGPYEVEADRIAAWTRGFFVFRDDELARVVATLNRHRSGHIAILDEAVERRRISGVFPLERPDRVLEQMIQALSIRATRLPGDIVLLHG